MTDTPCQQQKHSMNQFTLNNIHRHTYRPTHQLITDNKSLNTVGLLITCVVKSSKRTFYSRPYNPWRLWHDVVYVSLSVVCNICIVPKLGLHRTNCLNNQIGLPNATLRYQFGPLRPKSSQTGVLAVPKLLHCDLQPNGFS